MHVAWAKNLLAIRAVVDSDLRYIIRIVDYMPMVVIINVRYLRLKKMLLSFVLLRNEYNGDRKSVV